MKGAEQVHARTTGTTACLTKPRTSAHFGGLGWFTLLCLVITITLASYVIFHSYRFSLNTDGAVEDILAKLAIEEGRLVPQNWTYANGDLWILGPRLFLVMAFPWLGLGYLLHAIATWLTYLYLLLMVYGTCRVLAPRRARSAAFASLLAAGCLSTLNFEFVIGQGAYSLYAALALALFALAARGFEQSQRSSAMTLTLICVAALLVCISNATRGIVTVIAPLLIGWFAATLTSNQQRGFRARTFYHPIVVSVAVGACAGIAVFRYWLLPSVVNSAGAAKSQLASLPEAAHHMAQLPSAWFNYFEIHGGWEWLPPSWRVLQICVWILAAALLLAPLHVVIARKHYAASLQAFSWVALACYAISFAALVVSGNLFDGSPSMRYATFGAYASVCVLAIQMDLALEWRPKTFAIAAILLCIIPVGTIAAWRMEWTPGGITYSQRMALISSLEQRDIGTVLATYWNSEVLTVLSDGKVEALPVSVDLTAGLKRYAQNSPRTAIRGPLVEKQAIALTTTEASATMWTKLDSQLGRPVQRYKSGPFQVAVYDRNLTGHFYDSNISTDAPVPSNKLMIELSSTVLPPCRSVRPCHYWVDVTNAGKIPLATVGTKPFRLGIHGIDAQGRIVEWDAGRVDFPSAVLSGEAERVEVVLLHPAEPRVAKYQLCLLQEQVAWHCDRTKGGVDSTLH